MKHNRIKGFLKWVNDYVMFFLVVAFVTTCCMTLFLTVFSHTADLHLDEKMLGMAAKLTFGNVFLLSLLFTVVDAVRRKRTVQRPAQQIIHAGERIMQGDFSARVPEFREVVVDENFVAIGNCINKMAEELGSVETLRKDFVANVSHEMKTPLSVIQNYGVLLQDPELSPEKRMEYAKGITDGTRRLADMMTNILKLNRLENQKIFPENGSFDLSEQLRESLLQYEHVWGQAEISVEADVEDGVQICGDAELLRLVWNNLLSNAFKFTAPGGQVGVTLRQTPNSVVVKICDTGCGMTPEVGAHIFEKFYQGDPSRGVQGNGLGLALVKRVMDITKGEIRVESCVGVGSTFTVTIPKGEENE